MIPGRSSKAPTSCKLAYNCHTSALRSTSSGSSSTSTTAAELQQQWPLDEALANELRQLAVVRVEYQAGYTWYTKGMYTNELRTRVRTTYVQVMQHGPRCRGSICDAGGPSRGMDATGDQTLPSTHTRDGALVPDTAVVAAPVALQLERRREMTAS